MEQRGNFGTKIGVILATAGSAVGLGNIWRFPYMTGQDGGAAFILIYLVCMLFLGVPGMIAEFVVGRHSASNAVRAYKNLGNGKPWHIIGVIGVFTASVENSTKYVFTYSASPFTCPINEEKRYCKHQPATTA
jgi:neurotransmitter:Na+ symporter, NSS family